MPEFPFHVAGGAFPAPAAPPSRQPGPPIAKPPAAHPVARGSRRRRLWEIPHKFHCPVVGTCFDVGDLRSLMAKVMHFPSDTTDFVLHTTAVGACEERSRLADLLQKRLEKRFAHTIRRFAEARTPEALRSAWKSAMHASYNLPAALWAAWTHPSCDVTLEQEIYADIHMIQHQVGSSTRADIETLRRLHGENAELRRQLASARTEVEGARNEKARETRILGQRLVELRAENAGHSACIAHLTAQLDRLRSTLPDLKDRQALARRAADAEARAQALASRVAELAANAERLKAHLELAEEAIDPLATAGEPGNAIDNDCDSTLSGKCVLCVGGRTGTVDAYRQAVEERGGRFLHHDGGLEESLHRIDAALSTADLVICQAGCISHNAYWRVKEQCKRTGKRCLFVKNSGSSGFARIVTEACMPARPNDRKACNTR